MQVQTHIEIHIHVQIHMHVCVSVSVRVHDVLELLHLAKRLLFLNNDLLCASKLSALNCNMA